MAGSPTHTPEMLSTHTDFGFLHPNSKRLIQVIQLLLGLDPNRALAWIKERPKMFCRYCGGEMNIIETRISPARLPTTGLVQQTGSDRGSFLTRSNLIRYALIATNI